MHRSTPLLSLAAAAALVGAPGCRRGDVEHYRVLKAPSASPAPDGALGASHAPGSAGAGREAPLPPPPAPSGESALGWKLPAGWTQTLTGGMRYATIRPNVPGRLDVSVVVLAGEAGGELANVNRWRAQIGLPPIEASALGPARRTLRTAAGPVSLYEFESGADARTRVVAAMAVAGGSSWFIKMAGDAAAVGAARADFVRMLESLHRG